ncbi:MAG: hypothetical protein SGI92_19300 [Bryobacteraceae bacterium]|nr:hypothetical protein [Bryobacteraceae bacterium]
MLKSASGPWNIAVMSAKGTGLRLIHPDSLNQNTPSWAPGGQQIVFGRIPVLENPDQINLSVADVVSGSVRVLERSTGLFSPAWSPDGRYIAAIDAESFRLVLYDPIRVTRKVLTTARAGFPNWMADSKRIIYLDPDLSFPSIQSISLTGKVSLVASLVGVRQPGSTFGRWLGLTPDQRPLLVRDLSTQEIFSIELTH